MQCFQLESNVSAYILYLSEAFDEQATAAHDCSNTYHSCSVYRPASIVIKLHVFDLIKPNLVIDDAFINQHILFQNRIKASFLDRFFLIR